MQQNHVHTPYLQLLRPKQWIKNGFVLAVLFFSGRAADPASWPPVLFTFLAFCLLASAVYIFNDIRDLKSDRLHEKKRHRPLASGAIPLPIAGIMIMLLLLGVTVIAFYAPLPPTIIFILAVYAVTNIAYSLGLKQVPLVELFCVASGFVLRLIAGAVVINAPLTQWIVVCTGLIALLLVAGKRRADLAQDNNPQQRHRVLSTYSITYLDALNIMLSTATFVTYLIFCASSYAQTRYSDWVMVTAGFVALGIMRYLQLVMTQNAGDNPTDLVTRDPIILGAIGSWVVTFAALIYGF